MADIRANITEFFGEGDPRTKEWLLMDSPSSTIILIVIYLATVYLINMIMKNRKPFELRGFLLFYNILQVLGTLYMFVEFATVAYLSKYNMMCEPVSYSTDPLSMRMLRVIYLYYISKLFDFIDTIVFALRKKDNQITFLHVFHHASIFPLAWLTVKYFGGGNSFFGCMLNSLVHTIMYSYYGLASLGPAIQKHLWWKKYITMIQLIQFFAVMTHSTISIFYGGCSYSKFFSVVYTIYTVVIAGLFIQFYKQSYVKKDKSLSNGKKSK